MMIRLVKIDILIIKAMKAVDCKNWDLRRQ